MTAWDPGRSASLCASRFPGTVDARAESRGPAAIIDFTGSSPQVEGSINAVEAITYSACFYVFRSLQREDVPATAGLMRPIRLIAPAGTIVNAVAPGGGGRRQCRDLAADRRCAAAGRLAQVLPERIAAASSGTMNNLTIGGMDDRSGSPVPFAYYETIAGGSGASAAHDGVSGVHTHMTNSLNTPAEALEYAYPFRITRYACGREAAAKENIAAETASSAKSKC